jgi:hypothetical protein
LTPPYTPDVNEHEGVRGRLEVAAAAGLGSVVLVGLLGMIAAWVHGGSVSAGMAYAYYVVGCIALLVGGSAGAFAPPGGRPRRGPIGDEAFATPAILLGVLLVGLGVLFDVTNPF